jgi:naphthoate synthase
MSDMQLEDVNTQMDYEDVLYQVDGPVAVVTINRPSRLNAFRAKTIEELIHAFKRAWADDAVSAIILTGSGDRAFCVGGDVKQRTETGDYGPTSNGLFEVTYFHRLIRDVPKPVIAAVNGLAIGGGHVLHVLCDLSIAAEHARFGQAGPRVGSFDGGFGSAYLARVVGEKRAREIWFLCRRYTAQQAYEMGLVNKVVPPDQLDAEVEAWAAEINQMSPTAIAIAKRSFNADSENIRGISFLGVQAVKHYYMSEESKEGVKAFNERRKPDFKKYL